MKTCKNLFFKDHLQICIKGAMCRILVASSRTDLAQISLYIYVASMLSSTEHTMRGS